MVFPCGIKEVFHRFSSDLTVHRLIAGAVVVKDLRAEAYLFGLRDRVACFIFLRTIFFHNRYISVHTYHIYNYMYIMLFIYYKLNNVDTSMIFIFEYRFQCTK